MMKATKDVEKLSPSDLGDAVRTMRWTQEAGAHVKKVFTERMMAVDMELLKAASEEMIDRWEDAREEQKQMVFADAFTDAMMDFVEIDSDDRFNLMALWRDHARLHRTDIRTGLTTRRGVRKQRGWPSTLSTSC